MWKKPNLSNRGPLTPSLIAGLVASGLLAPAAMARPGIVVSNDLHGAPSTDAPVVDQLEAGTPQRFLLQRGQWLAVNHAGGLAWVKAVEGLAGDDARTAREDSCLDGRDTVTPRPHDRVKVTEATRLRSRLGHSSERDLKLSRGTKVWVQASDQGGTWLLVEDPRGHTGWVRGCEAEGVARQAGDQVEVTRAGHLLSHTDRDAQKVMPLSQGDRLTVVDWSKDWVKLTARDGMRGWYPVEGLETVDERDPSSMWQPGVIVQSTCTKSAARDKSSPSAVRCGDRLRVIRATGGEKQPRLLVVSDDGRWGWIDEHVTPIEIGEVVVADDVRPKLKNDSDSVIAKSTFGGVEREAMARMKTGRDTTTDVKTGHDKTTEVETGHGATAGMKMGDDPMSGMATAHDGSPGGTDNGEPTALARKEMGHEAMMGMGMGDMSAPTDGAAMSMSFQTAFPVGDAMTDDR